MSIKTKIRSIVSQSHVIYYDIVKAVQTYMFFYTDTVKFFTIKKKLIVKSLMVTKKLYEYY